jgi:hypothetical protein
MIVFMLGTDDPVHTSEKGLTRLFFPGLGNLSTKKNRPMDRYFIPDLKI